MKKILSYLFAMALLFSACNPMDDINKEIDAQAITNVSQDLKITLTDADYDAMGGDVADNFAFSASAPAASYIPTYLKELHPALTTGSVAQITYNYMNAYPDLSEYKTAGTYALNESDYNSVSETVGASGYFSPSNAADDFVPAILENAMPDSAVGTQVIVSYQYSSTDPNPDDIKRSTLVEPNFTEDLAPFTTYSVTGDQAWEATNYGAKMNGYSGGAVTNEDWLISPAINLNGYKDAILNTTQIINYLKDQWYQVTIAVSTDYSGTGDPNASTWTPLTIPNLPTGSNWTAVPSGDVDLSAYDGQNIYIAFKYLSNDSIASTWEIEDFAVSAVGVPVVQTSKVEEFYTKTASGWEKSTDAYYVKMEDYNAMGSPGKYDNFSSSDKPDNYLPQMLTLKFPYAQDGTTMAVVYKYYSSGVKIYGDQYVVVDGMWKKYDPIVVKTDQYILANTGEWVFDPAINYTMTSGVQTGDDYQLIIDYVLENYGESYIDVVYSGVNEGETYYGVHSYYGEFRSSTFNSKFATWQDAAKEAIQLAFLPAKFPNAVAKVDGIDVNYHITFAVYDGTMTNYVITFKCTKSGPNPTFEYVEGPTKE